MPDVTVAANQVSSGRITLVADATTTVTFAANIGRVQVWTDGTSPVYVTTNGDEPTVDGRHTFEVPPGAIGEYATTNTPDGDVVKLRSPGTPVVRVETLAL